MRTHEGDEVRAGLFAGGHAVPLLGVEVRAEVVAGHTRATVRQRYRNDEARPIEAIYTFPLSSTAVVCGFAMTVDGRSLQGEVKERAEAFRRYEEALTSGHGSALLEQERPNVFTANVGNLLPGEETVIEIETLEPIVVDEGAIRFSLPSLVAPRFMPANQVPDAHRISPPIGDARYGLFLELVFDVGCEVDVESPSHALQVDRTGARTRITFAQREVALDRDVVVIAAPKLAGAEELAHASVVAHRVGASGAFAVTLVPDLGRKGSGGRDDRRSRPRADVVFLVDRSGSMGGASMAEAKRALRLCLRQLHEGDRFALLAFDDQIEAMRGGMTTFSRGTLAEADRWIDAVEARGGTQLLEPLLRAAALAPDGVVVLLTDGQVGNEDEIAREVLGRVGSARIHTFGIGTNVSDALLRTLAERSGGTTALIHPGERIDDKVVAQFAHATARRVTDLRIAFRGAEVGELAPAEPRTLIDGVPFTLFGTYEGAAIGAVELRGTCEGERFYLEVPLDLPEREDRPVVRKLWAQARIRDLERAQLVGRRADAMKDRIVRLAEEHRLSSKYTSFVVVERRAGARRSGDQPETRVVPVSAPAGWTMFGAARSRSYGVAGAASCMAPSRSAAPPGARAMRPSASPMAAPRPAMGRSAPPMQARRFEDALTRPTDPLVATLERQSASGLWEDEGREPIEATVDALLSLVRLGTTSAHPVHGAQVRKAVEALLEALERSWPARRDLAELALAAMWLLSTGRHTRHAIRTAMTGRAGFEALGSLLARDEDVRAHVERIAPVC